VLSRYGVPSPFLLTVGADTPRRNYARLVDAVADRSVPPLVVVGATRWAETQMAGRAAARGIAERIIWLSEVPDADLAALYSSAATYVCPSLHEGFGMPVIEAFACGARVVCSNLPALREVAGEAATYFEPTNIESIGQSIEAASRLAPPDDAERTQLVCRARLFSWAESARAARRLYDRILTQPAAAFGRTAGATEAQDTRMRP
jgi:glycosyltransferase involved in cell wall biosynthesis